MLFSKEIKIKNRTLSENSSTFIIAEAGVNHNGDMSLAKEMIDVAIDAGADAVKFQSFKADDLILKNVSKAPYQEKTTMLGETQYEMLKKLEMRIDYASSLMSYCEKKGIIFLSTPFEENSLNELEMLGVYAYKVAATDITNIQFLKQVAKKKRPIILSAGMCYLDEVRTALEAISEYNNQVVLMQCTANYPIDDSEANIRIVDTFRKEFDMLIGYSDHSKGIGASPYAVALGAKVIEKHFTMDKKLTGPDHMASVTPNELKQLVQDIRRVEQYLGSGIKMPTLSECQTRQSLQKCLVAKCDIEQGELLGENNIVAKRTNGIGISALYYDQVVGKKAERAYFKDDIIEFTKD